MSELIKSLEKSVRYLKQRYPEDHVLLTDLQALLESLRSKKEDISNEDPPSGGD